MNWLQMICSTLVIAIVVWYFYFVIRSEQWTSYAKARLADNFWRVIDAGDSFSNSLLELFAQDLKVASSEVLSGRLRPVDHPSNDFLFEARIMLGERLDELTKARHFSDNRYPKRYGDVAMHLNAYIGIEVFRSCVNGDSHYGYELTSGFVERYTIFKASGLEAVLKPVPTSPFFPLEKIPKVFWNDSLRRHQELSGL